MKAVVFEHYGSPENLLYKDVAEPQIEAEQVLINIKACSLNSWDLDLLKGKPFVNRMLFGFFKPRVQILGCDIAGIVEEVGNNVEGFKKGDAVFGDISAHGWGGLAEFVCVDSKAIKHKPPGITFEQAAALPQAGVMALQSIQDHGRIIKNDQILINGAGGGVGTLAIQIAKKLGAEVTAVDHHTKLNQLRKLGADFVIDYEKDDFSKNGNQYDLIIDVIANRSIGAYQKSLKSDGRFEMIGGKMNSLLQAAFIGPLISKFSKKRLGILMHEPNKNLLQLTSLIEQGKINPIIDRQFPLSQTAEAFKYFDKGHFFGKVVIKV